MKTEALIILSPGFPKDEDDSTCLPFLQQFVEELNRKFHLLQIIVLAFDYPFERRTYTWKKNKIIPFNGWKKKGISKLAKWIRIWSSMIKIKRDHHVVGLLSLWCGECAYLGKFLSGRYKLRHFCWILGQDAKSDNKFVARIRPTPKELIAISDFIQRTFEMNFRIKPEHVIPVGIEACDYDDSKQDRYIDILAAGSLIDLKQYHILIQIVRDLRSMFPRIRVSLCGKGPEMISLRNLISANGLEQTINLTGEQSHKEILTLMSRTKIFLHPSAFEGMSAVCLEALASGCHVISFARSMQQEIPQWHIVSSKEQMMQKATSLLNDEHLLFQPHIPFTIQESVDKMMQLYNYNERIIS